MPGGIVVLKIDLDLTSSGISIEALAIALEICTGVMCVYCCLFLSSVTMPEV